MEKKAIYCLYCGNVSTSGRIHRMKQHLVGNNGEIKVCNKVLTDIRYQMERSLKEIVDKNKESMKIYYQKSL